MKILTRLEQFGFHRYRKHIVQRQNLLFLPRRVMEVDKMIVPIEDHFSLFEKSFHHECDTMNSLELEKTTVRYSHINRRTNPIDEHEHEQQRWILVVHHIDKKKEFERLKNNRQHFRSSNCRF